MIKQLNTLLCGLYFKANCIYELWKSCDRITPASTPVNMLTVELMTTQNLLPNHFLKPMPIFETWPLFLSQLDTKLLKTVFAYRQ